MLRQVTSTRQGSYGVQIVEGDVAAAIRAEIGDADAFLVSTPTVYELYARELAEELGLECLVLKLSESDKNLAQVERVCQEAVRLRLSRRGVIVAVGGGPAWTDPSRRTLAIPAEARGQR